MAKTLSEALKAAIRESEMSQYRIGLEADVAASVLSRFLSGERTMTLEVADRLAAVLGLELNRRGAGKARKGR